MFSVTSAPDFFVVLSSLGKLYTGDLHGSRSGPRVESGRFPKPRGVQSGWVRGCFEISRVGSGRVILTRTGTRKVIRSVNSPALYLSHPEPNRTNPMT